MVLFPAVASRVGGDKPGCGTNLKAAPPVEEVLQRFQSQHQWYALEGGSDDGAMNCPMAAAKPSHDLGAAKELWPKLPRML